jgi:GNAT superfamily N-acetyltransferase
MELRRGNEILLFRTLLESDLEDYCDLLLSIKDVSFRFQNISHIEVLLVNGSLIGCATLFYEQTPANRSGRVNDLIIDQRHQGKGYGRLLLERMRWLAGMNGCSCITVSSREEFTGFFERAGFSRSGVVFEAKL